MLGHPCWKDAGVDITSVKISALDLQSIDQEVWDVDVARRRRRLRPLARIGRAIAAREFVSPAMRQGELFVPLAQPAEIVRQVE